jgi:small subunit ribosomal protein S35
MSCEKFDTQAQNKRFLGETIQSLITAAQDSTDTFEDVPFDFRHHKPKKRFEFPKEWVLTKERKEYLEGKRAEAARLQDERAGNGGLVDGKTVIDTSLPFLNEQGQGQGQGEPVMVGAGGKQLR